MSSKSMVTFGGAFGFSSFLAADLSWSESAVFSLDLSSDLSEDDLAAAAAASADFSSSLSGGMGDGKSFRSTVTYTFIVIGRSSLDMSSPYALNPAFVLAAK